MAVGPVHALVEEVLTYASDYRDAEALREEAVNLAFDMRLGPDDLAQLLSALEQRTGTSLERRRGTRPEIVPKPSRARN
jgi:hypothetical protein